MEYPSKSEINFSLELLDGKKRENTKLILLTHVIHLDKQAKFILLGTVKRHSLVCAHESNKVSSLVGSTTPAKLVFEA